MSDVTLHVGGRPYTLSCADGEEAHVRRLAGVVDGKIAALGGTMPVGDPKALLIAALMLADEVAEKTPVPAPLPEESIVRGLEALATRLEEVATALEGKAPSA